MGWLETFLFFLIAIGVLLINALICSFFVILSIHKEEVWSKIEFKEVKK